MISADLGLLAIFHNILHLDTQFVCLVLKLVFFCIIDFMSVVAIKFKVWLAQRIWRGKWGCKNASSKSSLSTKEMLSSSYFSPESSSKPNSLKAFTKFDPLSVTVATNLSLILNLVWISSIVSAILS